MSSPVSVRFPDDVAARLRRRSGREPASGLVVRLVDEGLRMEEHPGIVFRDGPAGRRAGLIGGPDVWEVVAVLRDAARGASASRAVARTAEWLGLTGSQVRTAEAYYSAWPEEIDAMLAANAEAAGRASAAADARDRLYRA